MSGTDQQKEPKPQTWKRWLFRQVRFLAICYVGIFIVLLMLERRLIFHPLSASENWTEPPEEMNAQDLTFPIDNGVTIQAWWCPSSNWTPADGAILYCHGNGGNLSTYIPKIRQLQNKLGMGVLIFDYPGYGKSTGKPDEKGCYDSALAAMQWLEKEAKVDPGATVLFGLSLGGGVAIEVATRLDCRALVTVSTFTSVPDMAAKQFPWLPSRPFIRNRFESEKKLSGLKLPVFIAHGDEDRLIPFTMGERLFAVATGDKEMHRMPGKGHNDVPDAEFYIKLKAFLDKHPARVE